MCNRMLDMTLLIEYLSLSIPLQRELARSVGSNRDMIMENLRILAEDVKIWSGVAKAEHKGKIIKKFSSVQKMIWFIVCMGSIH